MKRKGEPYMATVKDIAALAGVSTATVSNVLNGKQGAAGPAKTREILELAESLQYRPNSLAKSLKKQKTETIGVITEDLTVFNTPSIVDGIEAFCEEKGYEILLLNMRFYQRYQNDFTITDRHRELFDRSVAMMVAKQVEGIVYVGYHCREIPYQPRLLQVPFVYAYCYSEDPMYTSVVPQDAESAFQVMEQLIGRGHRKIGILAGPRDSRNSQLRLEGCRRSMKTHNLPAGSLNICHGDWTMESGYQHTDFLLENGITAVFCLNDRMAAGLYRRCAERGITPGEDLAVFGYDDSELCRVMIPELSSVKLPLHELGKKSAELVFEQMERRKGTKQRYEVPCKMKIRASAEWKNREIGQLR